MKKYITASLETHLFFSRIMKEHSLFLQASFPAKESNYIKEADWYRDQFEKVLEKVVELANGRVGVIVLNSGEAVTEYTEMAERQTNKLTDIPINTQITRASHRLQAGTCEGADREAMQQVRMLNRRVIQLLNGLISFKENILKKVISCNLYTTNYPLLIEHITREARWYLQSIRDIENGRMQNKNVAGMEAFWNQIMMEHAQFIRGLLDPTECELIDAADAFTKDYKELCELAKEQDYRVSEEITRRTLETTQDYRDFKAAGTEGLTGCNIRSIIIPLLADHVLREANHYLRLLKEEEYMVD